MVPSNEDQIGPQMERNISKLRSNTVSKSRPIIKIRKITRARKTIATKHDCVRKHVHSVVTKYIKRAGAILRNQAHNGHKVSF